MYTFRCVLETFEYNILVKYDICNTESSYLLISRGCFWVSMKRGGCEFEIAKPGDVLCQKGGGGAVVLQLVPNLKESVHPPPVLGGGGGGGFIESKWAGSCRRI